MRHYISLNFDEADPFGHGGRREFPEKVTNVQKNCETSQESLGSRLRRRDSPINIETISGSRARIRRGPPAPLSEDHSLAALSGRVVYAHPPPASRR
jgi:hypothetical protein